MTQILLGKRALVTGGTRGIGRAIVRLFVKEGASVVFFGTSHEAAEEVKGELTPFLAKESTLSFIAVDVSDTKAVEGAYKEAEAAIGDIQILVNNAGITRDNLLLRMSEEDWDRVMAINLKSLYNTSRMAVRSMGKARHGKVINISSVVGLMGNAGQTNYAAAKAGVIGFSRSLAKEYAARNITVNCIAPGYIETAMTEKLSDPVKEKLLAWIPLGRLGTPDDVAQMALFLASPSSDYITGQVFNVDGGMVM